ncbi:ribbon-helix-helix protein, CopG family [Rhodococcus sp. NPDC057297]|uniref:ribbon-helix-helix protein, CopG family n=1 Tax=Rhodococcus sp. NPDC057297 TaxID=3346090 RepID=UPI003630EE78
MSTRKRRAAFDPNALNDLDDLLPPLNLVRDAAAAGGSSAPQLAENADADHQKASEGRNTADGPAKSDPPRKEQPQALAIVGADEAHVAVEGTSVVVEDEPAASDKPAPSPQETSPSAVGEAASHEAVSEVNDDRQTVTPRRADARRRNTKRESTANAVRVAPPEVALPHEVYSALRTLTLEERGANPTTARSYGQVVLDAVEKHADDLKAHWSAAAATAGTGMFRRAEAGRPTRRRHSAPLSRVPLAGVINSDAAILDQLAADWGAGSRSALVEQALRLYLQQL